MESGLEERTNEIKNEIKNFLNENKINFQEDEKHIIVKGEIFYIVIVKFVEVSLKVGKDKYLILNKKNTKLSLRYEETYPKEIVKKLEIPKSKVQAIYFTDSTLVILF